MIIYSNTILTNHFSRWGGSVEVSSPALGTGPLIFELTLH